MTIHAWLLIQTEVGRARAVADAVAGLDVGGLHVLQADTVTGPHDVIVRVEADSHELLGDVTSEILATIGGVEKVVTSLCLA